MEDIEVGDPSRRYAQRVKDERDTEEREGGVSGTGQKTVYLTVSLDLVLLPTSPTCMYVIHLNYLLDQLSNDEAIHFTSCTLGILCLHGWSQ